MKTVLGNKILEETRGLIYLCEYDYETSDLTVIKEIQVEDEETAMHIYANTPNPPSQVACNNDKQLFLEEVGSLHKRMRDEEWRKLLGQAL